MCYIYLKIYSYTPIYIYSALLAPDVFLIECINLPSHDLNVTIHKQLSLTLANQIDHILLQHQLQNLHYTTHYPIHYPTHAPSSVSYDSSKVIVLLHGWIGSECDWSGYVPELLAYYPVITVSTGCGVYSPSLFCAALRKSIQRFLTSHINHKTNNNTSFSTSSEAASVVLIGYSQGGRLAMHYRSLYPEDVASLIVLSAAPDKPLLPMLALEKTVINKWRELREVYSDVASTYKIHKPKNILPDTAEEAFLLWWYSLPLFNRY